MHIARSVVPLAVLAGILWTAAPVRSFDRGPEQSPGQHPAQSPARPPEQKPAAPKPPPPANNPEAQDRIAKKETRMKQRDKEIDKRLKQH
jgi:hypothetical protein